jgi:hypothetical protein
LFSNIDQRISICQKTYRYEQRFGLEKEVSFSFLRIIEIKTEAKIQQLNDFG